MPEFEKAGIPEKEPQKPLTDEERIAKLSPEEREKLAAEIEGEVKRVEWEQDRVLEGKGIEKIMAFIARGYLEMSQEERQKLHAFLDRDREDAMEAMHHAQDEGLPAVWQDDKETFVGILGMYLTKLERKEKK